MDLERCIRVEFHVTPNTTKQKVSLWVQITFEYIMGSKNNQLLSDVNN